MPDTPAPSANTQQQAAPQPSRMEVPGNSLPARFADLKVIAMARQARLQLVDAAAHAREPLRTELLAAASSLKSLD